MFDPEEKLITSETVKERRSQPVMSSDRARESGIDTQDNMNESPEEASPTVHESMETSPAPRQDESSSEPLLSTDADADSPKAPAASNVVGEVHLNLVGSPESHEVEGQKPLIHTLPHAKNTKSYEFRREYSKDHPLAGGRGEYSYERSQGLVPLGCHSSFTAQGATALEDPARRISVVKTELIVEPVRQFVKYKQDLERLFRQVLEEEELAEHDRLAALSMTYEDKDELDMITSAIQEDRARASYRIKTIAAENEKKLKEALAYLLLEGEVSF